MTHYSRYRRDKTTIKEESQSIFNNSEPIHPPVSPSSQPSSDSDDDSPEPDKEKSESKLHDTDKVLEERAEKGANKQRLYAKQHEIIAAKEFLGTFPSWLNPSQRLIPEVGDWSDDIDAILAHENLPRVVLGFMGSSGSGKSSIINALVEEEALLPSNCSEACTAVAVEISWNSAKESKRAYRAEIEFVTAAEWKAELEVLVKELLALAPKARLSLNGDSKVATAKIKALYPDLKLENLTADSATDLMNDIMVLKVIGKTQIIEKPAGKGREFAFEVSRYIDSHAKPAAASGTKRRQKLPYWPLVKVVRIFTKSQVLNTGLVLVDLPGSGDTNAAREMVAQGYMQQVTAICIVANIGRALTNSVARDLVGRGEALKRRLLRDGLLDDEHTFFVLTFTDTISNDEVIRSQGIDSLPEVSQILQDRDSKLERQETIDYTRTRLADQRMQHNKTMKQLTEKINNLQKLDLEPELKRKRGVDETGDHVPNTHPDVLTLQKEHKTRTDAYQNDCNTMKNLEVEAKEIEVAIENLQQDLTVICVRERNMYVTQRMKEDFALGLRDLQEELNDDGYDNEDEEAAPTATNISSTEGDKLQTFCVCSKAYQKLSGRFAMERMPAGFRDIHDTSVPSLQKHCRDFTLKARERLADRFLDDLSRLRVRMRGWADNSRPDTQITNRQRIYLEKSFKQQIELLQLSFIKSREVTSARLRKSQEEIDQRCLKIAIPGAVKRAPEIFEKWTLSAPGGAWKAICSKSGVHQGTSKKEKVAYNWNDDLGEELTRLMDDSLSKFANQVLREVLEDHTGKVKTVMQEFSPAIYNSSVAIAKHISNPVQNLLYNLDRLSVEMQREVESGFEAAILAAQNSDRKVPPSIRHAMGPGYTEASNISGKGTIQKVKNIIRDHISEVALAMYGSAAKELSQAIGNTITVLIDHLQADSAKRVEKIEADFANMLLVASTTPRPESGPAKVKLQEEVLQKMSKFDTVLGKYQESPGKADTLFTDPFGIEDIMEEGEEGETLYDYDELIAVKYEDKNENCETNPNLKYERVS